MATYKDNNTIPGQPREPPLPALTTAPQRHRDCCLSLSTTLLQAILSHVQLTATSTSVSVSSAPQQPSSSSSAAAAAATSQDERTQNPGDPHSSSSSSSSHTGLPDYDYHLQDAIISIGSGSGLLEACLQRHIDEEHHPSSSSPSPLSAAASHPAAVPSVIGVEVNQLTPFPSLSTISSSSSFFTQQGLNRYLPPHRREFVKGTWDMWPSSSPSLGEGYDNDTNNNDDDDIDKEEHTRRERSRAVALMFVYPRLPALVRKYVDAVLSISPLSSSPPSSSPSSPSSSPPLSTVRTIIYLGPRVDWPDFEPCFQHSDEGGRKSEIKVLAGEEAGLLEYEMMAVVYIR